MNPYPKEWSGTYINLDQRTAGGNINMIIWYTLPMTHIKPELKEVAKKILSRKDHMTLRELQEAVRALQLLNTL